MKYIKKISAVLCAAALGIATMTSCEGGDIISVNSPSWLQEKIDSIAAAEAAKIVTVVPTPTTIGELDCSTEYDKVFTETIKLENDKSYVSYFTNLSTCQQNYHNFYIFLTKKDVSSRYAILRADNYENITNSNESYANKIEENRDWSEWKDAMNGASCVSTVKNKNGKVDVSIIMTGNNGKTYTQSYSGIPVESDNVYLQYSVERSALIFNDGSEVKDYEPESMVLNDVPTVMTPGENLDAVMANVTATIKFAGDMVKTVDYKDLVVTVAPDLTTLGQKYLVASYAKTFNGKAAKASIHANAQFTYGGDYTLELTTMPTHQTYYINTAFSGLNRPDAVKNFTFDPTGLVVSQKVGNVATPIDNSKLTFTTVPTSIGLHEVTIKDQDGKTLTVNVNVKASDVVNSTLPQGTLIGKEDNSTSWTPSANEQVLAGKTLKYVFTNYGVTPTTNWNHFLVEVLDNPQTFVYTLRADNFGWYNVFANALADNLKSNDWNWDTYHSDIQGAEVTVYVTNNCNGCVDVECAVKTANGDKTFHQAYYGLSGFSADNVWSHLTVDCSHLVIK